MQCIQKRFALSLRLNSFIYKDLPTLAAIQTRHSSGVNELNTRNQAKLPEEGPKKISSSYVLKRRFPMKLAKKGAVPYFKKKNYVYEEVGKPRLEDKEKKKKDAKTPPPVPRKEPPMPVILTRDVLGLGVKGELLCINRRIARLYLFPSGIGVYDTPENRAMYPPPAEEVKDPEVEKKEFLEKAREKLADKLSLMTLYIPMSLHNEWTLTPKHVRIALRWNDIIVPEENIELPVVAVTGPVEEITPVDISVKVNEETTVKLVSYIHPWCNDKEKYSEEIKAIVKTKKKNKKQEQMRRAKEEKEKMWSEGSEELKTMLMQQPNYFIKEACGMAMLKQQAERDGRDVKVKPKDIFQKYLERKDSPEWKELIDKNVLRRSPDNNPYS